MIQNVGFQNIFKEFKLKIAYTMDQSEYIAKIVIKFIVEYL